MRRRVFVGCLALPLVAGCRTPAIPASPTAAPRASASPPRPTSATSSPTVAATPTSKVAGDLLFVRDGFGANGRLAIVDAATGKKVRDLPFGVASPDWRTIYTVECSSDRATLNALDVATGQVTRQTRLEGCYAVPATGLASSGGLSPNGKWLTLQGAPEGDQIKSYQDSGHWKSHLVVVDTLFKDAPRLVKLNGNFWFDAIDDDGRSLFLIENLPDESTGSVGTRYHVRRYDLSQGALQSGVVADKTGSEVMSGLRHSAIASPDGQWVYSLYLNQTKGPFIHALNVSADYAICVFLPTAGKDDFEKGLLWTLTMTPDGGKLYVANAALGLVSEVGTSSFQQRTATLPKPAATANGVGGLFAQLVPVAEAKRILLGGSVLSPDRRTLFVLDDKGILAIETGDLTVRGRFLSDWVLDSVAISPNGSRLYVMSVERRKILAVDPATGAVLKELAIDANARGLLKVASAV